MMSEVTIKGRLAEELIRARKLLSTSIKPLLADIPLENRLDLARTLAREESINYLAAQIQLGKPIVDETPPWEDDSDVLEFLENEEAAILKERAEQENAAEQAVVNLRDAEITYELYVASKRQEATSKQLQSRACEATGDTCEAKPETCSSPACARIRRSLSKDDIGRKGSGAVGGNRKSTTGPPALRRRPSFLADTSQSQIEVHLTCSNCRVNNEAIIDPEDLAAIVQPQECVPASKMVTSTPHVAQRVRDRLFNNKLQEPIPLRRSSSVHFEDEKHITSGKDSTFDIEGGEKENKKPQSGDDGSAGIVNQTVVKNSSVDNEAANSTTVVKKANTTIIKDRDSHKEDPSAKAGGVKSAAPRIGQPRTVGLARSRIATTGIAGAGRSGRSPPRRPALGSTSTRIGAVKTVLPSKTSGVPGLRPTAATGIGRPGGVNGTRDVVSSGLSRSGPLSRPSKPAMNSNKAQPTGKRVQK